MKDLWHYHFWVARLLSIHAPLRLKPHSLDDGCLQPHIPRWRQGPAGVYTGYRAERWVYNHSPVAGPRGTCQIRLEISITFFLILFDFLLGSTTLTNRNLSPILAVRIQAFKCRNHSQRSNSEKHLFPRRCLISNVLKSTTIAFVTVSSLLGHVFSTEKRKIARSSWCPVSVSRRGFEPLKHIGGRFTVCCV